MTAEQKALKRGIPLTDDSLFLRKPIPDENGEEVIGGRGIVAGLIVKTLAVFLSLLGVYLLAASGVKLPVFQVAKIEVRGAEHVTPVQVKEILAREFPGNLNDIDILKVRQRLERMSWIKSARISKIYPNTLAVDIQERRPVGVACMESLWLFDNEGVLLEEYRPGTPMRDQPFLSGLLPLKKGIMPEENRERMALFVSIVNELSAKGGNVVSRISEVDVSDRNDIVIVPMEGTPRVHLGAEKLAERTVRFFQVLPRIQQENSAIGEVDLRSEGMVVLKPAGER